MKAILPDIFKKFNAQEIEIETVLKQEEDILLNKFSMRTPSQLERTGLQIKEATDP